MTKAEYPFPTDEFDDVEASGPRGVHRAPRSRWSRVWPFLLVIVLFPALAFAAVTYWSNDSGDTPSASTSSQASTPDETASETPSATPSDTPSQTPTPAPTQTQAPVPTPDLSTPVVVFNSTSRNGIAAKAAKVLTSAGWTDVTPKNYTGGKLGSSTVIYGSADLEVTAQAAAAALGLTTVKLAEGDSVDGLEIVLENDYTP